MPAFRVIGRVRCVLLQRGEINPQFPKLVSGEFDDLHLQEHGGQRPDQPANALDLGLENSQSFLQRVLYLLGLLAELECLVGPAGRLQVGRRLEQMVGLLADHLRRRGNAGRAGVMKHAVDTGHLFEQRDVQRWGDLRDGRPIRIRLLAVCDAQRSGDDTDQQDSPHSTHSLRQVSLAQPAETGDRQTCGIYLFGSNESTAVWRRSIVAPGQAINICIGCKVRVNGFRTSPRISSVTTPKRA